MIVAKMFLNFLTTKQEQTGWPLQISKKHAKSAKKT